MRGISALITSYYELLELGVIDIILNNKIILVLVIVCTVAATMGCSFLEDEFENSILSFKIPENWTVVDTTNTDTLASLKPMDNNTTQIDITSTDISPQKVVDGYVTNYPSKYPSFKVIKNEPVTVDGEEGIRLVYQNTGSNEKLVTGPIYISSVVAFSKYNQTYIISSREVAANYYENNVEPAMNKVVSSIKIKGYMSSFN